MKFGMAPKQCGIHSKPQPLLQKTYFFYVSKTLVVYIGVSQRTHALAKVRKPLPTNVGRGSLLSFISKNRFLLI